MRGLTLVIGSEGLVGSRFVEISENRSAFILPRQVELDITKFSEIKAVISSYNFTSVVNFAAFTDVSKAEEQRGDKNAECWQVNVEGVKNLVEAVKPYKTRIHFIQISTDMVFPGTKDDPGPYLENHPLDHDLSQLSWYGYTKAEAEKIIRNELGLFSTVVRISYPVRARFDAKLDYIRKILNLFDEGKLYPMFSDQQISISFIDEVCKALDIIISQNHRGTFHVSSRDTTTPYELASYVLEKLRGVKEVVMPTTLDQFLLQGNNPLRYPKYGGLSVSITQHKLGVTFSSWREIVDKIITQGLN